MRFSLSYKHILSFTIPAVLLVSCSEPTEIKTQPKDTPQVYIPLNERYTNQDSEFPETSAFDKSIMRFLEQWKLKGASVAVMRNDSLLYAKGYGFANEQESISTDVSHLFRVASVSKLITAAAIMKLCEQNKLSLHSQVFGTEGILKDSVHGQIRDSKAKLITVEHLLRHQGGFSRRQGDPLFETQLIEARLHAPSPYVNEDLIQYATKSPLRFRPGTYASYSNLGYAVLEKVIEEASGTPYEKYVKENVLRPAGCNNMYIGNSQQSRAHKNEVAYYEPEDSELIPDPQNPRQMVRKSDGGNDIRLLGAAGGWIASPIELLRFISCINGNDNGRQILSQSSVWQMTADCDNGFPIGWMNVSDKEWRRSGSMAGTSSLIVFKKEGYSWAFITNTSTWRGSGFTQEINSMMNKAIRKVESWPERDMFESTTSVYSY